MYEVLNYLAVTKDIVLYSYLFRRRVSKCLNDLPIYLKRKNIRYTPNQYKRIPRTYRSRKYSLEAWMIVKLYKFPVKSTLIYCYHV